MKRRVHLDPRGHHAVEDAAPKTFDGCATNIPENLVVQFGMR
jgi:hypothetical protein